MSDCQRRPHCGGHETAVDEVQNGRSLHFPSDQPSLVADFINIVLDDEYGLRELAEAPSTILDIGANIGLFSWMAARVWPDAKVLAFEPNTAAYEYAVKNSDASRLMNVAVGRTAGRVNLGVMTLPTSQEWAALEWLISSADPVFSKP